MQEWCFPFPLASIPLTPCRLVVFVGVVRAVTLCNYCRNRIGLLLNARFCHYGFSLDAIPRPVEHPFSMQVSPVGTSAEARHALSCQGGGAI